MINIYIMNQDLQKIGVVDNYTSLIWSTRYVEFGDCEIYVPATPENLSIFQLDNYIMREDDDMICKIETVELDTNAETGDYLIITGADCRKILNQRIVWKTTSFSGTAENFIRRLINQNIISPTDADRIIPRFKLGEYYGFDVLLNLQTSYEPVGDKIAEICRMYGYGFKVSFDGSNFVFDIYSGVDRSFLQTENPYVVFSDDFENLKSSKYLIDKSNYGSVALVGGSGEGKDRLLTMVNTSIDSGINRYEIFVDAKSTSKSITYEDLTEAYAGGTINTVSGTVYYSVGGERIATLDNATDPQNAELLDAPYYALLGEAGNEKLAEMKTLTAFEGEVEAENTYRYKTDYFIGDIVQIKNEFGIERAVRIVEVVESFNDEGHSVIPTFEHIGGE